MSSGHSFWSVVAASLGAVSFLCASSVQAEDSSAEVAARDERARELFQAERYGDAILELEAAQALRPATARLFNLAQCHERLDHLDRALELYQRYIDESDELAERRAFALRRVEELRLELARQATEAEPPEAAPPDAAPPVEEDRLSPVPFYVTLGLTALVGVGVAVLGPVALSLNSRFEEDPRDQELRDRGWPLAVTTDVLIGVGAALAVTTLVLGLLVRRSRRAAEPGQAAGWPLGVVGRF